MSDKLEDKKFLGWPVGTVLDDIAKELGGTINHYTTSDSMGRQSKKIVIEYDITKKQS